MTHFWKSPDTLGKPFLDLKLTCLHQATYGVDFRSRSLFQLLEQGTGYEDPAGQEDPVA
jgi:hypothetical protein